MTGLPLMWLNDGSEPTDIVCCDFKNSLSGLRTGKGLQLQPVRGCTLFNFSGLLTQCGRDLTDVVVLWSLTSPYHFSSPAIDSVSVGRRTDKGMCMTLPTDTGDI